MELRPGTSADRERERGRRRRADCRPQLVPSYTTSKNSPRTKTFGVFYVTRCMHDGAPFLAPNIVKSCIADLLVKLNQHFFQSLQLVFLHSG
jgi:hypothetical protein